MIGRRRVHVRHVDMRKMAWVSQASSSMCRGKARRAYELEGYLRRTPSHISKGDVSHPQQSLRASESFSVHIRVCEGAQKPSAALSQLLDSWWAPPPDPRQGSRPLDPALLSPSNHDTPLPNPTRCFNSRSETQAPGGAAHLVCAYSRPPFG